MTAPLHLAVALEGAGWHPAAWREPDARPADLFTAPYWRELVTEADRALLDFVTFEDTFGIQTTHDDGPDERTDQVRGRLDAALVAAAVAPHTTWTGLVPTVIATHTEPFHVSKAIATLDYVARGRAGWRVRIAHAASDAALVGRRELPAHDRAAPDEEVSAALFDEAADHVQVVRELWDSWEDDAEIRDVATGRFVDRHKLHYVDFAGRWFSVKGPSITPRPPQGQPLVVALAHNALARGFAGRAADVVLLTPSETAHAAALVAKFDTDRLRTFADLVVFLDETSSAAADRRARLDELAGAPYTSDAAVFTGTPEELARLLRDWRGAGIDGFRLRPGALPHDLTAITRGLVPLLQREGEFRRAPDQSTLRGRLGLSRPANRYATAEEAG